MLGSFDGEGMKDCFAIHLQFFLSFCRLHEFMTTWFFFWRASTLSYFYFSVITSSVVFVCYIYSRLNTHTHARALAAVAWCPTEVMALHWPKTGPRCGDDFLKALVVGRRHLESWRWASAGGEGRRGSGQGWAPGQRLPRLGCCTIRRITGRSGSSCPSWSRWASCGYWARRFSTGSGTSVVSGLVRRRVTSHPSNFCNIMIIFHINQQLHLLWFINVYF